MNNKGNIILSLLGVVAIIGIVVIIAFIGFQFEYGNEKQVTCTVDDKWIKRASGDDEELYLVSCDEQVYKISDLFFKGKFDSSNIYAKLKIGKKYKLTVTGYRFGYFSSYQNINDYKLIKEKGKER
ncbi:MAG: hypothetical protein HFJ12_01450 [Bacilli bacterium]|nr:hypothetical protein [Bacilli bacterium]